MTLTPADRAMFASLGISEELLTRARIERVTDCDARERYGLVGHGDRAGVVFPYYDPITERRWTARLRRDNPDVEDGKPKNKYVSAFGDRRHLYFVPGCADMVADSTAPIVLVEAEKSALAITAWSQRVAKKLLPVAMGGCWGWRGRIGKRENANGQRVDEVGPLPDLTCAAPGRKVYILLDANAGTNPKVQAARAALASQLRKQRADVHILDLPQSEGVNGPDDFLSIMGDKALADLFDGAADGTQLLEALDAFVRRFVILSPAQSAAIALWVAHTYTFKFAAWTPYLNVRSAAPECGKSHLLEVLEFLVRKPWKVDGASPAVLYRKIEVEKPTLLFDELDTTFKGDKEAAQAIRQVLNAGAKYNGTIARLVGENHMPKDFSVFCPKALAGIGNLPPTVSSRALPITLARKLPSERVEYLDHDSLDIKSKAAELRKRLSDWTERVASNFKVPPEFPDTLSDRQKDGARILLAIADTAGGKWPSLARTVLCEIYGTRPSDDVSIGVQLLIDLRAIFGDEDELEKVATAELVERLARIETSPWSEWNRGKAITGSGLARLLNPFGIFPKTIRIATVTAKGYERVQFEEAWDRYCPRNPSRCPSPPSAAVTPSHPSIHAGPDHFSSRNTDPSVTAPKGEESPLSMRVVTAVTAEGGGNGHMVGAKQGKHLEDFEL